jgi:hypothetical protein
MLALMEFEEEIRQQLEDLCQELEDQCEYQKLVLLLLEDLEERIEHYLLSLDESL